MVTAKLLVSPTGPKSFTSRSVTVAAFGVLALLPDADVFLVALGAQDHSAIIGHRGASHSLIVAALIGLLAGLLAQQLGWRPLRIALAVAITVASHGLLDSFCQGGRGIPLFWPFSLHRFHAPWRLLPDAPRGVRLLSSPGLFELAREFIYFMPLTIYALWPARAPLPKTSGESKSEAWSAPANERLEPASTAAASQR